MTASATDFQSEMILPTSLFEAFKHPLVGPLISPITCVFVSFPAVFLCGFPPGLTTGFLPQPHAQCHPRDRRRLSLAIAQVHLLYELDGRARPRITREVPPRALPEFVGVSKA